MKNLKHSQETIDSFMERAENLGLADDYLFISTLERYKTQVQILSRLRKTIEAEDTIVTKEYIRGRENLYTHPAITEYNKTCDSTNKTAQTIDGLMKSAFNIRKKEEDKDPLVTLLEGKLREKKDC